MSIQYQLRLLLEEVCCDLCRFEHVTQDGCPPGRVQIDREFKLGSPSAFADIRVVPPSERPYFVEVKYGYMKDILVQRLKHKYGPESRATAFGSKVIVVSDVGSGDGGQSLAAELCPSLDAGWGLRFGTSDNCSRRCASTSERIIR